MDSAVSGLSILFPLEGPYMQGGKYALKKIIWQIDANDEKPSGVN
jgi:hypothetical protein